MAAEIAFTKASRNMKSDMLLYLGLEDAPVHNQIDMSRSFRKRARGKSQVEEDNKSYQSLA